MRVRAFIVAVATAAISVAIMPTGNAATGMPSSVCPASPLGAGPVLLENVTTEVMVNNMMGDTVAVLNNPEASIVCTSAWTNQSGFSGALEDGTVFINSNMPGVDSFFVGAVLGGSYYTTAVTVNTIAVKVDKPIVTKKIEVSNGKVKRPATVRLPNNTDYKLVGQFGSFKKPQPDTMRWIASGKAVSIKTTRVRLNFQILVELGSRKVQNQAVMAYGTINTKTGKVEIHNAWVRSSKVTSGASRKTNTFRNAWSID